jgi:bifunctional DNA-binding transcriptional regulator/antitoxin component of YhaV-PrlF toxin-antitoxin module
VRQVLLRPKRQVTIPRAPCEQAGLVAGDRLRVRAEGNGKVVFERIDESDTAMGEPPV